MTAEERLAVLDGYARPRAITKTEAFRWVDESTPLGVIKVLNDLLRIQDAWIHYASLVDLEDQEDKQDDR